MPTYAYACTECDHRFEAQQAFTDDALTECPECEGRLRKLFNAVGIVFKGSGFYRTDSRGSTGAGKSPASSGSSEPASAKGSGESSPAAASTSSSSSGSPSSASSSSSGSSSGAGTAKTSAA